MIWIRKLLEDRNRNFETFKNLRIGREILFFDGNNILLFHDTKSYNKIIIIIFLKASKSLKTNKLITIFQEDLIKIQTKSIHQFLYPIIIYHR